MNINNMQLKDVSEETLRKYLESLDEPKLILGDDLKVTHYQNGDPIPLAVSKEQFMEFGKKEIGCYSINEGNYLYNWYAVNDKRELSPTGWKIPTDKEWGKLENQLKENPSYAGCRDGSSGYYDIGHNGYFWSSTESNSDIAWLRLLSDDVSDVYRSYYNKNYGFSVRCLRD
jgi:hypothetical protein